MFCIGYIISTVVSCKANGYTQAKIVTQFMKSINPGHDDIDAGSASHIANGDKNPSIYVMDALAKLTPDDYEKVVSRFKKNILCMIKENEINLLRDMLILIIKDAKEIKDDNVVDIIGGLRKSDLNKGIKDIASFLAGIFVYALKNTKNNVGGYVKNDVKKYRERVLSSYKLIIDETEKPLVTNFVPQSGKSREVELMEGRIEQEANAFCIKYDEKKSLIPLCQIVHITNPTKKHFRKMYNEYCASTASTREKILELNDIPKIDLNDKDWWYDYFDRFRDDYIKFGLGEERYLHVFGEYFYQLLNCGSQSIVMYLDHVFPINIRGKMFGFAGYKHDIFGVIDEYFYYSKYEKYKNKLEPPMDFFWRELNLGGCDECMLEIILALFIIGTCYSLPQPSNPDIPERIYHAPSSRDIETAEDLFYLTLLVLYETYGLVNDQTE